MADKNFSQFTEDTSPDVDDYLVGHLNSETSGSERKIKVENLLNKFKNTISVTAESGNLSTGGDKYTCRAPSALKITGVRASVNTAPVGSTIIIDINVNGSSILASKLTIDAGEKTSTTAAVPVIIATSNIADDAEISIDIDQVGSSTAGTGLKVTLIGYC